MDQLLTRCPYLAYQYTQPKRHGDLDLLTLKVCQESHVTWATSVPILVFLVMSVLDLGPMYATDRQTSDAHHRLMPLGRGIINSVAYDSIVYCRLAYQINK